MISTKALTALQKSDRISQNLFLWSFVFVTSLTDFARDDLILCQISKIVIQISFSLIYILYKHNLLPPHIPTLLPKQFHLQSFLFPNLVQLEVSHSQAQHSDPLKHL